MHADLQFDRVKKVDTPIPIIVFVIPEKFPEVEYKVYLFSKLPKTILNCNKYYVPMFSLSSFNALKLEIELFPIKGV